MLSTVPETASASSAGLNALLTSAAFAPLDHLGWIRVTGTDRVRWLNGMVTNNIAALKPGQGCYNFFLNAQGRIQGDATAWMFEDFLILETARDRVPALMAMLEHFIIMDDVELTNTSDAGKSLLSVAGPGAPALLEAIGIQSDVEPMHLRFLTWRSSQIEVAQAPGSVPSFEIFADTNVIAQIGEALREFGVTPATQTDLEHLRILSGTPIYGIDIRNSETAKDLAQETNQTRALHFSKGCYLGQEIVERIRSRGAVHRTFSGFLLDGDLPQPGTALHDAAKPERPAGELTSVARIQLPSGESKQFALGYIRREALDAHAALTYPGGTAVPSPLPFPIS